MKLVLLRVNESGTREKINVRLVSNRFKDTNTEYLYEGNLKRKLEFFSKNLNKIFPENDFSLNQKKGTSL